MIASANVRSRTRESEFYSAGSPAAAKRYRYMLGTTAYDALNRVKSPDFSSWSGSAWTTTLAHDLATIGYDKSGNLTTFQRYRETGTLIDNLSYTYTAGASAETWDAEAGSFTYDGNGNVKTSPAPYSVTATTYDHRNLATAVTRAGVTTSYRYNEGGWRIAKQVGTGNQELYIQDGPVTLAVFTLNASGTLVSWYGNVLAGERVVGRQPSVGNRSYYHTDLLGTTRAVVQGAVVVESYDYDPYGMLMPGRTLAGTTKEGFTSKERDAETGLDYFGARYYMGAVGRWTAVDPLADEFPAWNPYNYVMGNPVAGVDPDGRCPAFITGRPCSGLFATSVGLVPVVGDGIEIAGAAFGRDFLTGERIAGSARAATVVGTVFLGSGRLARQGAEVVGDAGRAAIRRGQDAAGENGVEVVQRAMSRAELKSTMETGLLRGGRPGTHFVSGSVNSDPLWARQRLALGETPEIRATLEVPGGVFSPPFRVTPANGMPGGGLERTASGEVPVRIIRVDEYRGGNR